MKKVYQVSIFILVMIHLFLFVGCKSKVHQVKLELNGGTSTNNVIQVKDGECVQIDNPTKEGYRFVGWFTDKEELFSMETPVQKSLTLHAKWEKLVQVVYVLNGATNDSRNLIEYTNSDLPFALYEPTKKGYIFTGWKYEGNKITELPETSQDSICLEAEFTLGEYQITYILNGATNHPDNPTSYTYEDLPFALYEPTLTNKHFMGWYYKGSKLISIPKSFQQDIELEARFEDIYTIEYIGKGVEDLDNPTEYYSSMGTIHLNSPSLPGYTFVGWRWGNYLINKIPTGTTGNLTLTAVYEPIVYHITYILNEGINNEKNPDQFTVKNLPFYLKEPTREGYIFLGWTLNEEYVTYIPIHTLQDITLVAHWKVEPIYHNMIFVLNQGTLPSGTPAFYEEGKEYILPIPVRSGYHFVGWNKEADGSGERITKITAEEKEDVTIYAIWQKTDIFSPLTLHFNSGTLADDIFTQYEEGKKYILPIPKREGYEFQGWYFTSTFEGEEVTQLEETQTGEVTLYAKWEMQIPSYQIHYDLNGGTFGKYVTYHTKEEMVTAFLNDFSMYLKSLGWKGESISTTVDMEHKNDFVGVTTPYLNQIKAFFETTSYANDWGWMLTYLRDTKTDVSTSILLRNNIHGFIYGVRFESWPYSFDFSNQNYAEGFWSYLPDAMEKVVYEFTEQSEDIVLPSVIRVGYTFLGWYDENNQKVTVIQKGTHHDIFVQARYESNLPIYTVTYHLDGGTLQGNIVYDFTELDQMILPTAWKQGYIFDGWYTNASYSGEKMETIELGTTTDLTLYAKYRVITYPLILECDGGVSNNPTSFTVESPTITLLPAVKEGFTFLGWYTLDGQKVEEIIQGSIDTIYLIAKYEAKIDMDKEHIVTFIFPSGYQYKSSVIHGEKVLEIEAGMMEGLDLAWYLENEVYDFEQPITKAITLQAKWYVIEEIYQSMFTSPEIVDNIKVSKYYNTSAGEIVVNWSSDDYTTLNMVTGFVNPNYTNKVVTVTGVFGKGTTQFTVERKVTVGKVNFIDLSTTQPVFGYFYSNMASLETPEAALGSLNVINYGFARATSVGTVDIKDLKYIEKVTELRKKGIRVLLCIGGYGGDGMAFSMLAMTKEGREKFAASILKVIEEYHFDGVDIDWEYPGFETGQDVTVDRPNYTLLMAEIRRQLKQANPEYLVTAATPGGKYGYVRYELGKLNSILDYIHMMTYDLQASGTATHHTGLYTGSYTPHGSVEQTVNTYYQQGVSKNKLVVGIAFYGRQFRVNSSSSGIGGSNMSSSSSSITYTRIYDEYLSKVLNGSTTIRRYWDDQTKAPYIYDTVSKIWISYDDPESIGYKCEYVKNNHLGGVMFWDYGEDKTFQLIEAIYQNMRK